MFKSKNPRFAGRNSKGYSTFFALQCGHICSSSKSLYCIKCLPERYKICPKGHNKEITGKNKQNNCLVCSQERNIANNLMRSFKMTIKQYNDILKKQNGKCAICKKENKNKRLSVDHDHKTGLIRGLLCNNCNQGLGHFRDNLDFLMAAMKYLINSI